MRTIAAFSGHANDRSRYRIDIARYDDLPSHPFQEH
jgi:hypothetical protein